MGLECRFCTYDLFFCCFSLWLVDFIGAPDLQLCWFVFLGLVINGSDRTSSGQCLILHSRVFMSKIRWLTLLEGIFLQHSTTCITCGHTTNMNFEYVLFSINFECLKQNVFCSKSLRLQWLLDELHVLSVKHQCYFSIINLLL